MTQEKIQEKYMQFQMLQQQMQKVSEHLQMFNEQVEELEISKGALQELQNTQTGNEILAPIANGIFIKAKLEDNQKMIVNVGNNTTVEKTVPQLVEMLAEQQQKIQERIIAGESVIQELNDHAMNLYQEVEKLNDKQ